LGNCNFNNIVHIFYFFLKQFFHNFHCGLTLSSLPSTISLNTSQLLSWISTVFPIHYKCQSALEFQFWSLSLSKHYPWPSHLFL
jgi:hypothetical protein